MPVSISSLLYYPLSLPLFLSRGIFLLNPILSDKFFSLHFAWISLAFHCSLIYPWAVSFSLSLSLLRQRQEREGPAPPPLYCTDSSSLSWLCFQDRERKRRQREKGRGRGRVCDCGNRGGEEALRRFQRGRPGRSVAGRAGEWLCFWFEIRQGFRAILWCAFSLVVVK